MLNVFPLRVHESISKYASFFSVAILLVGLISRQKLEIKFDSQILVLEELKKADAKSITFFIKKRIKLSRNLHIEIMRIKRHEPIMG